MFVLDLTINGKNSNQKIRKRKEEWGNMGLGAAGTQWGLGLAWAAKASMEMVGCI